MTTARSTARERRETVLMCGIAVLLVLIRAFAPVRYEGFHFDSDQAIVGLMAKHLAELRVFPLFFYGQNYMLGVQAWMAAPLFALGRPSVGLLRAPLVGINCAVAVALIVGLARTTRMRPALALVAALPFIVPPPIVADKLVETLGASVEPFLYVLVLWMVRQRPYVFGTLLCIGFLHREFTIFALPALLAVEALNGRRLTRDTWLRLARMAAAFGVVWIAVDLLKRHLNGSGPATGPIVTGPLTLQIETLWRRLCFGPQEFWSRFESFFVDCLPDLFGVRRTTLVYGSVNSAGSQGSILVGVMLAATAVMMTIRSARRWSSRVRRSDDAPPFVMYLLFVGLQAIIAYPLSCEILPGYAGVIRYALLVLLIPTAVFALYVTREDSRLFRALAAGAFVVWAAANLVDHAAVVREYATNPPPNKFRGLANYLMANRIKYARAGYWDSYIVDFLSRERVIVASTGKVRITEYQDRVDAHAEAAVDIQRVPCSGGVRFDAWCISGTQRP